MSELILEICSCRSAFSFASPKENADSSEPASPERAPRCSRSLLSSESGSSSSNCKRFAGLQFEARRDFDFPPALLEPTKKTASVFLDLSRDSLKTNANPYCPIFYPQDVSPQIFKRNCSQIRCSVSGGAQQKLVGRASSGTPN